jgi:peptide chain release factor 1
MVISNIAEQMADLLQKLEEINLRYRAVSDQLGDPALMGDMDKYIRLNKEFKDLEPLILLYKKYASLRSNILSAREILQTESDTDLREMAQMELEGWQDEIAELEEIINLALIPKDPEDTRNVIVEIRAGTGGDEASIFAGDLFRMYTRFAEKQGWKVDIVNINEGTSGGFKEVSFEIEGEEVFGYLKFERGVHRVQRVPETESQGRVHTSAATVAVLPEVDDVDIDLRTEDVRIDTFRASGAGGQHVNKTESAIRLTHIPSGIVVECQDGRSQHKNKEKAFTVLRSRLYEMELQKVESARAAERKSQVSSGDRSAKIRTYNYPQSRVTDHRIGLTLYNLEAVMNGELETVIDALRVASNAEKLSKG